MFDKFGRAAERVATGLSRRQFLGRFGALGAAAVIGGLLALPSEAKAGRACLFDEDCGRNQACCEGGCVSTKCPPRQGWCGCGSRKRCDPRC